MITIAQAVAILSILMAFGVPQTTVDQVHDILIPTSTTTPVIIVQTPVIPDAPVYFGSTKPQEVGIITQQNPVDNTPTQQNPVVESKPMDTTAPKFSEFRTVENGTILAIASNELLDFQKTTFTNGVTMGDVIFDATNGPKQEGITITREFIGEKRLGAEVKVNIYNAKLNKPEGVTSTDVTVQDLSGNTATYTVSL